MASFLCHATVNHYISEEYKWKIEKKKPLPLNTMDTAIEVSEIRFYHTRKNQR